MNGTSSTMHGKLYHNSTTSPCVEATKKETKGIGSDSLYRSSFFPSTISPSPSSPCPPQPLTLTRILTVPMCAINTE